MKVAAKKITAKPITEKDTVSLSERIRAKAKRNTKIVNGAIMLDPNNPSDRELWFEDEAGEPHK